MQPRRAFSTEQLQLAEFSGISFPTITPFFKSPPNRMALKAWVERLQQAHPLMGKLAQVYSDHIDYIPYETFIDHLKQTITAFQQHAKDQPYVLWIPQHQAFILEEGCSDQWVAGLALEHTDLHWPAAILATKELPKYLVDHPEMKTVLALDDAAYSGKHISEQLAMLISTLHQIDNFNDVTPTLNVYIGIPFQTARANKRMHDVTKNYLQLTILPYRPIAVLGDHLNTELTNFVDACNAESSKGLSLTYFDHCMPDFMSTAPVLGESHASMSNKGYLCAVAELMWLMGYACARIKPHNDLSMYRAQATYVDSANAWNNHFDAIPTSKERLVPVIIRPYRLHTSKHCKKLKEAIKTNEIGIYTGVNIPERYSAAQEILQASLLRHTAVFFAPAAAEKNPQQEQTSDLKML